jgi:N-acyl amino acid synthase of PEP-CTERM/exosortase system
MNDSSVIALASSACADGTDLLARFNAYFRTQTADTPAFTEMALAIRYQVYCLERKFEDPAQHVDGLESDEFDPRAIHSLIIHRPTAEAIGTVRLILPGSEADGLPVERLLSENDLCAARYFPVRTTAEVSRFAISNEFRRRKSDVRPQFSSGNIRWRRESERRGNLPCLGLIQILVRQSVRYRITHWTAVMEPKLLRMLAGMGIHFTPVGPLIFHHGLRQPSYCYLPQMLERLRREQPEYWNVVSNAGEFSPQVSPSIKRHAA